MQLSAGAQGQAPDFLDIMDAKWRYADDFLGLALQKDMQDEDYETIMTKLKTVKKAEVMCGLRIDRDDPLAADGDKFLETARSTFQTLLPLYKMSLS